MSNQESQNCSPIPYEEDNTHISISGSISSVETTGIVGELHELEGLEEENRNEDFYREAEKNILDSVAMQDEQFASQEYSLNSSGSNQTPNHDLFTPVDPAENAIWLVSSAQLKDQNTHQLPEDAISPSVKDPSHSSAAHVGQDSDSEDRGTLNENLPTDDHGNAQSYVDESKGNNLVTTVSESEDDVDLERINAIVNANGNVRSATEDQFPYDFGIEPSSAPSKSEEKPTFENQSGSSFRNLRKSLDSEGLQEGQDIDSDRDESRSSSEGEIERGKILSSAKTNRPSISEVIMQSARTDYSDSDDERTHKVCNESGLQRSGSGGNSLEKKVLLKSVSCQTELSVMVDDELIALNRTPLGKRELPSKAKGNIDKDNQSKDRSSPMMNYFTDEIQQSFQTNPDIDDDVRKVVNGQLESEPSFDQETLSTCSDDDTMSNYSTSFMPSVGPPSIVKYQRESDDYLATPDDVETRLKNEHQLKPTIQKSVFSGPCQYCKKQILPLPTNEELSALPLSKLFCCEEYENFIRLHLSSGKETFVVRDEIIDIAPSEHFGTKAARKAAKERAAERLREREIEKQRAAAAQANFFSFARQMKTIQYSLSSPKCMSEGWTIKPSSPIPKEEEEEDDAFQVDVNTTSLQKARCFYERFYDDGKRFLVIFPDGSGCCYYPSGNLAVLITTVEEGKYSYFAFKNKSNLDYPDSGILGIFEPNGTGCCYFSDGNIRLVLSAYGGMQSDKHGNKQKRWQWNANNWHNHTPPLHPICLSLNKSIAVRVKNQNDIVLTFTCSLRSVRFNVGAKLKLLKPIRPKPTEYDEHDSVLRNFKHAVGTIFSKMEATLRFPNSPRLNKLSLPSHLGGRRRLKKDDFKLPAIVDNENSVIVN